MRANNFTPVSFPFGEGRDGVYPMCQVDFFTCIKEANELTAIFAAANKTAKNNQVKK
jgi:hypothetical protein